MRTVILMLFAFSLFSLHAQETYTITARSGLSLRAEPAIDAERIGGIPFNTQVLAPGPAAYKPATDTIDGVSGRWVKVRYGEQEGYAFSPYLKYGRLFSESRDGVNEDYRISIPGMRFETVNYDPDLHWYALTTTFADGLRSGLHLQKVDPILKLGPEVSAEESGYSDAPNLVIMDAKLPDNQVPILFIGTADSIHALDFEAQITFWSENLHYPIWGRRLHPYQEVLIGETNTGDRYSLVGRSIYRPELSEAPIYELSLLENGYYRNPDQNVVQSITEELLNPEETMNGEVYRPDFFDHPQLCWSSDINGDGLPDMVFYEPMNHDACGGEESYILLVSEKTEHGWRWRKVSEDTIFYEGC